MINFRPNWKKLWVIETQSQADEINEYVFRIGEKKVWKIGDKCYWEKQRSVEHGTTKPNSSNNQRD